MIAVPFALYNAFSDVTFGGSQAAIVSNVGWLNAENRQKIATEIGVPATGFITACDERSVSAHFHSTITEYPMCGHGTICLMSRLIEQEVLKWHGQNRIDVDLHMPTAIAAVEIHKQVESHPMVYLDIKPPSFHQDSLDLEHLMNLLGLHQQDCSDQWPVETASGDFVHLIVPLKNLEVMRRIEPNFTGLTHFWHEFGIQTVAVFCTETEQPDSTLHVRDFCPAVGVTESAAAGTTNSALTSYLVRHQITQPNADGQINVKAEQGCEINRTSSIHSIVSMQGDSIVRLQVGGVATKVINGELHLPADTKPYD